MDKANADDHRHAGERQHHHLQVRKAVGGSQRKIVHDTLPKTVPVISRREPAEGSAVGAPAGNHPCAGWGFYFPFCQFLTTTRAPCRSVIFGFGHRREGPSRSPQPVSRLIGPRLPQEACICCTGAHRWIGNGHCCGAESGRGSVERLGLGTGRVRDRRTRRRSYSTLYLGLPRLLRLWLSGLLRWLLPAVLRRLCVRGFPGGASGRHPSRPLALMPTTLSDGRLERSKLVGLARLRYVAAVPTV